MTELRTHRDGVRAADSAITAYRAQRAVLDEEFQATSAARRSVAEELLRHERALAVTLLPLEITADAVARVAEETGATALVGTLQHFERIRTDRAEAIAGIEANPEYPKDMVAFQQACAMEQGEIDLRFAPQIREALADRDHAVSELRHFEAHPGFDACAKRNGNPPSLLWRVFSCFPLLYGIVVEIWYAVQKDRLCKAADLPTLEQVFTRHASLENAMQYAAAQVKGLCSEQDAAHRALTLRRQAAASLDQVLRTLRARAEQHDATVRATLEEVLTAYISSCDLGDLHGRIRESFPLAVTTLMALREKLMYLERLALSLAAEMQDRDARIAGIEKVRRKWQRSPGKPLRGDKKKWLVDGPAAQATRTERCVHSYRTMRCGIYDFTDYVYYDTLYDTLGVLIAYDVFAHAADLRMPSDAFACSVIPELGACREEYGMAGPDYAAMDAAVGATAEDAALAAAAADAPDVTVGSDDLVVEPTSDADFADLS